MIGQACRLCDPFGPATGAPSTVCRWCEEQMPAELAQRWREAAPYPERMKNPSKFQEVFADALLWARQRGR